MAGMGPPGAIFFTLLLCISGMVLCRAGHMLQPDKEVPVRQRSHKASLEAEYLSEHKALLAQLMGGAAS